MNFLREKPLPVVQRHIDANLFFGAGVSVGFKIRLRVAHFFIIRFCPLFGLKKFLARKKRVY